MKRTGYVDNAGNVINQGFESKKPLLHLFLFIGTVLPLIFVGFIIYTAVINVSCNKVYDNIKKASLDYLKEVGKVPLIEGEHAKVNITELYNDGFLQSSKTNSLKCSGSVKVTKYKSDYIYTLNVNNCKSCTVSKRYGKWSNEQSSYNKSKPIVDVVPYYNYYGRQVNTTGWSKYFEESELQDKKSKYGVKLPIKEDLMPEVPEEANIVSVQKEEKMMYRHQDKTWRWYDKVGDYSDFSSEQPTGYANRDDNTKIYSEWSDYSQSYPEEKSYREIKSVSGYKYYYEKDGKKFYANNGDYVASDEIDNDKYDKRDKESVKLYCYRDSSWRWYNGTKRRYSAYSANLPKGYNYKDEKIFKLTAYSSWKETSSLTEANKFYRVEESKILVKYAYVYEFLTLAYLDKPVQKKEFVKLVDMSVPEFVTLEDYKMEVTYKFKYRKR